MTKEKCAVWPSMLTLLLLYSYLSASFAAEPPVAQSRTLDPSKSYMQVEGGQVSYMIGDALVVLDTIGVLSYRPTAILSDESTLVEVIDREYSNSLPGITPELELLLCKRNSHVCEPRDEKTSRWRIPLSSARGERGPIPDCKNLTKTSSNWVCLPDILLNRSTAYLVRIFVVGEAVDRAVVRETLGCKSWTAQCAKTVIAANPPGSQVLAEAMGLDRLDSTIWQRKLDDPLSPQGWWNRVNGELRIPTIRLRVQPNDVAEGFAGDLELVLKAAALISASCHSTNSNSITDCLVRQSRNLKLAALLNRPPPPQSLSASSTIKLVREAEKSLIDALPSSGLSMGRSAVLPPLADHSPTQQEPSGPPSAARTVLVAQSVQPTMTQPQSSWWPSTGVDLVTQHWFSEMLDRNPKLPPIPWVPSRSSTPDGCVLGRSSGGGSSLCSVPPSMMRPIVGVWDGPWDLDAVVAPFARPALDLSLDMALSTACPGARRLYVVDGAPASILDPNTDSGESADFQHATAILAMLAAPSIDYVNSGIARNARIWMYDLRQMFSSRHGVGLTELESPFAPFINPDFVTGCLKAIGGGRPAVVNISEREESASDAIYFSKLFSAPDSLAWQVIYIIAAGNIKPGVSSDSTANAYWQLAKNEISASTRKTGLVRGDPLLSVTAVAPAGTRTSDLPPVLTCSDVLSAMQLIRPMRNLVPNSDPECVPDPATNGLPLSMASENSADVAAVGLFVVPSADRANDGKQVHLFTRTSAATPWVTALAAAIVGRAQAAYPPHDETGKRDRAIQVANRIRQTANPVFDQSGASLLVSKFGVIHFADALDFVGDIVRVDPQSPVADTVTTCLNQNGILRLSTGPMDPAIIFESQDNKQVEIQRQWIRRMIRLPQPNNPRPRFLVRYTDRGELLEVDGELVDTSASLQIKCLGPGRKQVIRKLILTDAIDYDRCSFDTECEGN